MVSIESLIESSQRYWREYPGSARFWDDVRDELEGGNKLSSVVGMAVRKPKCRHPTTTAIRKALKSGKPVPEWAADYICDRLDRTVRLPRGAPEWSPVGLTSEETRELCPKSLKNHARFLRWRNEHYARWIRRWQRVFSHPRYVREYKRKHGRVPAKGGSYRQALDKVSAETGISPETLDTFVYPRRKHPPQSP